MGEDHRDPETYAIIGAAMEVHRTLGPGFHEAVYHESLCREFTALGIPYLAEVPFKICYKGRLLDAAYRADLICFDKIVVELKALREIGSLELGQLVNYLKASGCERGLLLNFGERSLRFKRCIDSLKSTNGIPTFPSDQSAESV